MEGAHIQERERDRAGARERAREREREREGGREREREREEVREADLQRVYLRLDRDTVREGGGRGLRERMPQPQPLYRSNSYHAGVRGVGGRGQAESGGPSAYHRSQVWVYMLMRVCCSVLQCEAGGGGHAESRE